jgi:glycosyltransferase involved in cell wall biosynthesis
MRVLIANEAHFCRGPGGRVWANGPETYAFWQAYRTVFEQVFVLARVGTDSSSPGSRLADGEGVAFAALDDYCGPWQYLARRSSLRQQVSAAVAEHAACGSAFLLRVPGAVAYLAWDEIRRRRLRYAVEVLGDPQESLRQAPGSWALAAPLARRWSRRRLTEVVSRAPLACYVTASALQQRYPAGGAQLTCPDVRLNGLASASQMAARRVRLREAASGRRPWQLGLLGSLEQLYKGPDVALRAVACCVRRGWNLRLALAGEGRCRRYLDRLAAGLGLAGRVDFLGALPPGPAVDQYLDRLDLYLQPSRTEGLPRALVEAMARGCPAIGSAAGGIPELLDAEALVPPGQAAALSVRIETFLESAVQLQAMAEQNRVRAERYLEARLAPVRREFLCRLRYLST